MDVLNKDQIIYGESFQDKNALFERIADLSFQLNIINNKKAFVEGLQEREKEYSTCFGNSIAIPHCRSTAVNEAAVVIVKSSNEIDWGDGQTASMIICLEVPEDKGDTHIKLLSSVARKLVHDDFVQALKRADSAEALYNCFTNYKGNDE